MITLSERMKMAADLVREGKVCCDIGTDHAYLPAYLIETGKAPYAIASDLRKGPLMNAEKTVKESGLSEKIELRLSDGFENIRPGEADDFILSGMGGTLMSEIISKAGWLKNKKYRLILQPQSHGEDIRKWLLENGFELFGDRICMDSGKLYCAFAAEYRGIAAEYSPSYLYLGNILTFKSKYTLQFVTSIKERLITKRNAQSEFGSKELAEKIDIIIKDIEDKINEYNS